MTKIILGIVVLIALAAGGYYMYTNYSPAPTAPGEVAGAQDTVQIQDVTVGEGVEATPGSVVSVLYVGRLEDGTVFDSSEAYGNEPLTFVLGNPGLIPGFQIGINGMKVGGERAIAVPASLAYGTEEVKDASGKVVVPANSTLIFNIGLVNVQATTTTPGAGAPETE